METVMARQTTVQETPAFARELGDLIGQALGEGIAQGLTNSLGRSRTALAPITNELVGWLRNQALAAIPAAVQSGDGAVQEGSAAAYSAYSDDGRRVCTEAGCGDSALARGLCRRHYARILYQERKARQVASGVVRPIRQPRVRAAEVEGGTEVEERKNVRPVAPIVRRKTAAEVAAVPVAAANGPILPTAVAPPSAEAVARWLGIAGK